MTKKRDLWLDQDVEFARRYGGCGFQSTTIPVGTRAHVIGALDRYENVAVQLLNGDTMRLSTWYLRLVPQKPQGEVTS